MQDDNRPYIEPEDKLPENKKEGSNSSAKAAAAGMVGGAAIAGGATRAPNPDIFNNGGEARNPDMDGSEDNGPDNALEAAEPASNTDANPTVIHKTEHHYHPAPEKPHDPFQDVRDILYHESERVIPEPEPLPPIIVLPGGDDPEPWPDDPPVLMYAAYDPTLEFDPPVPLGGGEGEEYFLIEPSHDPEAYPIPDPGASPETNIDPEPIVDPEPWTDPYDPGFLNVEMYAGPDGWEDITDDPSSLLDDPSDYNPTPD